VASRQLGTPRPYTYDTASNVVTVTLPNGIVSTSHCDQLNRITLLTSPVSSYTYQLSPTGNRTNSSELNGRTVTWNYNGVYQLTEQTVAADPAGVDGQSGDTRYVIFAWENRVECPTSL
jgi:YD repeat-containing protein